MKTTPNPNATKKSNGDEPCPPPPPPPPFGVPLPPPPGVALTGGVVADGISVTDVVGGTAGEAEADCVAVVTAVDTVLSPDVAACLTTKRTTSTTSGLIKAIFSLLYLQATSVQASQRRWKRFAICRTSIRLRLTAKTGHRAAIVVRCSEPDQQAKVQGKPMEKKDGRRRSKNNQTPDRQGEGIFVVRVDEGYKCKSLRKAGRHCQW